MLVQGQQLNKISSLSLSYEAAIDVISSNSTNIANEFLIMFEYLKMLELEDSLSQLKVIHVAGTKGKIRNISGKVSGKLLVVLGPVEG